MNGFLMNLLGQHVTNSDVDSNGFCPSVRPSSSGNSSVGTVKVTGTCFFGGEVWIWRRDREVGKPTGAGWFHEGVPNVLHYLGNMLLCRRLSLWTGHGMTFQPWTRYDIAGMLEAVPERLMKKNEATLSRGICFSWLSISSPSLAPLYLSVHIRFTISVLSDDWLFPLQFRWVLHPRLESCGQSVRSLGELLVGVALRWLR